MNNKIFLSLFLLLSIIGVYFGFDNIERTANEKKQMVLLNAKLSQRNQETDQNTIAKTEDKQEQVPKLFTQEDTSIKQRSNPEKGLLGEEKMNETVFPEQYNNSLMFHSQSPFGTWGEIFGETCEEASVLLAYLYVGGLEISAQNFRDELLRIVNWENQYFGKFKHTNVDETAEILGKFYGYDNYEIKTDPSVDDMKRYLSQGAIILAPFYGVGMNPYYSDNGPEYHFMLLKGYTTTSFISHDVGTKRGENYEYSISSIMERLHDYHPEDINKGGKKIIVVYK